MFTIPLTSIGVIVLYVGTGTNFSLFTAVGLVVLVGIVVNNGIVLVDYTNLLRKRGRSIDDACVEAGGNRLRPILMTTLTTVLGLLPVAFAEGEGSSLVQPIAKTVVGGLTVATLLTLYLVPVVYSVFNRKTEKCLMQHSAVSNGSNPAIVPTICVEVIANRSIQEDFHERLRKRGIGAHYTLFPEVQGTGYAGPRRGDHIWPEENFRLHHVRYRGGGTWYQRRSRSAQDLLSR